MGDRVRSIAEAAALIEDGSHLALGGFAITRCVTALVHELIRRRLRHLTLSQAVAGFDTDLLAGAGCVEALIYAGGSLDRFGPLHNVNRAISSGTVALEECSSLALTLRYHAAGLGLPFMPSRSLLGSDLLQPLVDAGSARLERDPFSGRPTLLLKALRPDWALIHADVADDAGNAIISGPLWTMREAAFAARRVILTAERIVAAGELEPDAVTVPATVVAAVAPAPAGAHPTAVYRHYDYDAPHLRDFVVHSRKGADGVEQYLERYVLGTGDHAGYLRAVGVA
jgi:acyl CoA:acetate/3-ketoacid CoA transferase alpha subunit